MIARVYFVEGFNQLIAVHWGDGFGYITVDVLPIFGLFVYRLVSSFVMIPPRIEIVDSLIVTFRVLDVVCNLLCQGPFLVLRLRQISINFLSIENPAIFGVLHHWAEIKDRIIIILKKLVSVFHNCLLVANQALVGLLRVGSEGPPFRWSDAFSICQTVWFVIWEILDLGPMILVIFIKLHMIIPNE